MGQDTARGRGRLVRSVVTPGQVRLIRQQFDEGGLDVKAWAATLRCNHETVRRIARRETYAHVSDGPVVGPSSALGEPGDEEVQRSLERLRKTLEAAPVTGKLADSLIEEMKGEPDEG